MDQDRDGTIRLDDLKEVYADKQWALPPVWELA